MHGLPIDVDWQRGIVCPFAIAKCVLRGAVGDENYLVLCLKRHAGMVTPFVCLCYSVYTFSPLATGSQSTCGRPLRQ